MMENQLIALVIATITAQEAAAGVAGTPIKQAFQPTQQGVNTGPTAYMFKVGDVRRGSPSRTDIWDEMAGVFTHIETQIYETTFQISALSTQNPANVSQLTASDLLNQIAYILQSDATIAAFNLQDVGILRIADVRNPRFVDDRGRHEAQPSLDFVLTHKQIVATETPVIQSEELQIIPV